MGNVRIELTLDENTTFGDIRRFAEITGGFPDDRFVHLLGDPNSTEDSIIGIWEDLDSSRKVE